MFLGRYRQRPYDRRKRGIDFTDFLESGETIAQIVSAIATPDTAELFTITSAIIDPDGKKIAYYAGGGQEGTYTVAFRTRTSLNQYREDTVEFEVEENA